MAYLIDTNVVSELRKKRPAPEVELWMSQQHSEELYFSVATLSELKYGVERLRLHDPQQAIALDKWVTTIKQLFASRFLPATEAVAEIWGGLCPAQPLPIMDGLIAATALHHGLTVVTRNVRDFQRAGVSIFNPFAEFAD